MKLYFSILNHPDEFPEEKCCILFKNSSYENDFTLVVKDGRNSEGIYLSPNVQVFFLNQELFEAQLEKAKENYTNRKYKVGGVGYVSSLEVGKYVSIIDDSSLYFKLFDSFDYNTGCGVLKVIRDYTFLRNVEPQKNFFNEILQDKKIGSLLRSKRFRYIFEKEFNKIFSKYRHERIVRNINNNILISLKNAGSDKTSFEIPLDVKGILDSKIFCIIGKNGVGKSRLLKEVRNKLKREIQFNKVIALNLYKSSSESPSLDYVNLDLVESYSVNIQSLITSLYDRMEHGDFFDRATILSQFMKKFLPNVDIVVKCFDGEEKNFLEGCRERNIEDISKVFFTDGSQEEIFLSQGQNYIFKLILSLLVHIEDESVVLFDEPEVYLHPNYLVMLVEYFELILRKTNSFAIFSTHSIFIIREIPKSNVRIMRKNHRELLLISPKRETLGGSLDRLAEEVFYDDEIKTRFEREINNTRLKKNVMDLPADLASRILSND